MSREGEIIEFLSKPPMDSAKFAGDVAQALINELEGKPNFIRRISRPADEVEKEYNLPAGSLSSLIPKEIVQ